MYQVQPAIIPPPGVTPKNNGNDDKNSEQSVSLIALVGISLAIVIIIILIVALVTVLAYRRGYSFAACWRRSFSRSKPETEDGRLLLASVPLL